MAEGLVLKDIIDMVLRNKSIILSQLTKDDKSYGVPQRRLTGHSHFVEDVVLSSDCYDALSGNWDGELRLRDLATGDSTRRFVGHTKDVLSVAFSVGNRQIVSVSGDRTIKLWNSLGECKYTISEQGDGYKDWISCVRFSPNMPTIVSGSWDHTLKVWNLQNCKLRNSLAGYLNTVAVSPDCSLCASCGKDGVILLWDLTEGKKLYSLKAGSIIHSLCFSPNRYWLCAATENSIKIWDLESKSVVEDLQLMEMNASESESFENLTMKLNQTLSLVKELKCELYNAKKGEAQALKKVSAFKEQLEIQNSRIEMYRLSSLTTELEQSKSKEKSLYQCKGELEAKEISYHKEYMKSMLEIRLAYEQVKAMVSQYVEREAKLGEELKNIKTERQVLRGLVMYREEKLREVKELLNLKIKEIKEAEEVNLENSLNQKEAEVTDKLKKLESDLMEKEMKLQNVTSQKESLRMEMEKMQSEKNLVIDEARAAQVTNRELEAKLRELKFQYDHGSYDYLQTSSSTDYWSYESLLIH